MRARKGPQQATVATAHKIARIVYHLLKYGEVYEAESADTYEQKRQERELHQLTRRAAKLGDTLAPFQEPLPDPNPERRKWEGFSPWACSAAGGGRSRATRMRRPPPHAITQPTTGAHRNHLQHGITRPTTGAAHHGPANYARRHGLMHAGAWRHGRSRIATDVYDKNGLPTTLPQRPNALPFTSRERAASDHLKKLGSRARSGQLQRQTV
jgi:hypothetical protein